MIHEMFDAASASTKVPLQTRPHHPPTRPWPIAHGHIRILNAQHVVLDQIHDLFVERGLQPVTDVTRKLLFQLDRLLPDRCVKRERLLDRVRRSFRSSDNFHQWNDVRRIEWMSYKNSFRVLAL